LRALSTYTSDRGRAGCSAIPLASENDQFKNKIKIMLNRKQKINFLLFIAVVATVVVFFMPCIPQNADYNRFADTRTICSVPNFYNVVSNLLFLVFGSLGIFITVYFRDKKEPDPTFGANLFFFLGILLTGIGSSYYHLHPATNALLWDRLPMTVTFMAFFAVIISEHIDQLTGKRISFHLLFLGIISVIYWYKTELNGHGDLRFYGLVQFLPMLLIPSILLLFRSESQFSFYYWCILVVYLLAKLSEHLDHEIYSLTGFISGHSLKHVFASFAPLIYFVKLWSEKIFEKV